MHTDSAVETAVPPRPEAAALPAQKPRSHVRMRRRSTRRVIAAVVAAALVASFAVASAVWAPLRRQVMLSVTQRPAHFTELYLSKPATLPRLVPSGRIYQLPYTIVNHTGHTTTYRVSLLLQHGDVSDTVSTSSVVVADGAAKQSEAGLLLSEPRTVYRITLQIQSGQRLQWTVATT